MRKPARIKKIIHTKPTNNINKTEPAHKSLNDLLNEGKTLKEISKIYKEYK